MTAGGFMNVLPPAFDRGAQRSLSKILRRVAYPVEPFGFMFVQHDPPPALPGGVRGGLGKEPGLFDRLDDGQANEFQCVHGALPPFPLKWLAAAPTPSIAAAELATRGASGLSRSQRRKHIGRNAKNAGRHQPASGEPTDANRAMSQIKAQYAAGIQ